MLAADSAFAGGIEDDATGGRRQQPGDEAEQRRFARAVGAGHRQRLAGVESANDSPAKHRPPAADGGEIPPAQAHDRRARFLLARGSVPVTFLWRSRALIVWHPTLEWDYKAATPPPSPGKSEARRFPRRFAGITPARPRS